MGRIIPVALIMSRSRLSIAQTFRSPLPRISRDLAFGSTTGGTVAGIFFWGYIALQIPGAIANTGAPEVHQHPAGCMGHLRGGLWSGTHYHELLMLRLLLGVAESGVHPAT